MRPISTERATVPAPSLIHAASLALAVTPINVATNRNNTIDSLLVLVVLPAALAVSRAAETERIDNKLYDCSAGGR